MKEKGFDNSYGLVYEIKEKVRRGKYYKGHMSEDIKDTLLECDVPQWYVESMQKIQYLFPKSYLVILLKREMNKYTNNNQEIQEKINCRYLNLIKQNKMKKQLRKHRKNLKKN